MLGLELEAWSGRVHHQAHGAKSAALPLSQGGGGAHVEDLWRLPGGEADPDHRGGGHLTVVLRRPGEPHRAAGGGRPAKGHLPIDLGRLLPPGHLGAAKLAVGAETAALASGGVVGVGPRLGRGQGVGLVRLAVTPTLQQVIPAPVSRARETMTWDGKMAACLTPSLRSTWPASRRAGTIQGRCGGWTGRTSRPTWSGSTRAIASSRTATTSSRYWWWSSQAGAS